MRRSVVTTLPGLFGLEPLVFGECRSSVEIQLTSSRLVTRFRLENGYSRDGSSSVVTATEREKERTVTANFALEGFARAPVEEQQRKIINGSNRLHFFGGKARDVAP